MQISMVSALACLKTVKQRPCVTREIKIWLSDNTRSSPTVDMSAGLRADPGLLAVSTHVP